MILLGLLITAMVLTAGLTFEAMRAERAHRAAVRRALRDDASVLADDLLRRTIYDFEMFAAPPLRGEILRYLRDHNVIPSKANLASNDTIFVIDRLFLIDMNHGT